MLEGNVNHRQILLGYEREDGQVKGKDRDRERDKGTKR
jgi:hypothetical protein